MALTRRFSETVVRHLNEDPACRAALIEEAYCNILNCDHQTGLSQLRDAVNATVGLDALTGWRGDGL